MSRSFRHTPGRTVGYGSAYKRVFKRLSAKKNRRDMTLVSGSLYKRNGLTYDICDFRWLEFTRASMRHHLDYECSHLPSFKDLVELCRRSRCYWK